MRALFIGGGKSGKSTAAQKLAAALADGGPLYYWATMTPHDGTARRYITTPPTPPRHGCSTR